MLVLGLDTTRKGAIVFVVDTENKEKTKFCIMSETLKHSDALFLHIEKILLEMECDIKNIDALACVVGPGSFTGIRVGMATIKGLNKVLNKPIVSLNVFDIVCNKIRTGMFLLNGTSSSCYHSKIVKNLVVESGVVDKMSIEEVSGDVDVFCLKEEQQIISLAYNKCKEIDNYPELLTAQIIKRLDAGEYGEFVPYYLQLSQAERNLK